MRVKPWTYMAVRQSQGDYVRLEVVVLIGLALDQKVRKSDEVVQIF